MNPRNTALRVAATSGVAAVLFGMAAAPAVAADGDVDVLNTETVQVYTSPTGEIEAQRVYEQLILTGNGSVDLSNPISTDGLRNLDGFSGVDTEGGAQVTEMTVDGEEHLRTVSDFDGDLPLDVSVTYKLDGETVEPGDIVGESGELEVLYTVKNITAQPQEVSFPDGSGGTTTETVDVPIPMVGSLSTVAPESFTNVRSDQANMAGDGKGGTKLSFTMTLFPPIGSDTAEFGYTADIVDGVVPRSDVSALPVNPLESPTFAAAADSYQGGTDTGARLAEGAATIDSNLLKLRDGAAELLAGLIKLRNGSERLQTGLADEAAPGASKLADGAGKLDDGLGKIADGANRLFDGTGQLVAGTGDLTDGTGRLADGANRLSGGAGRLSDGAGRLSAGAGAAYTGSQQLTDGLQQISGGLGQLADAKSGLPAAQDGIKRLQGGVDLILAGFGTTSDPATLIGGLQKLELGLGELEVGAQNLAGGLSGQLRPGLGAAKGGVDQVQAGLADAVKPGGNLDQLLGGLASLEAFCDADEPACMPTIAALKSGASTSKANLTAANAGLVAVSNGLATAIGGLDTQLIPGANQIAGGLTQAKGGAAAAKGGAIKLKEGVLQVDGGLTQLEDGITKAVAGVLALSTGADSAAVGSSDLTAGLSRIDAGAGELASGAGRLAAGTDELAAGTGKLDAGANRLAAGAGKLDAGAGKLAGGTAKAADGSSKLSDGAGRLAEGLVDAAEGSGRLTAGLGQAADGAPKLVDGAQKLSDKGTSKLVEAGEDTTQTYGQMYATMQAGAERAQTEDMAYGAPEGAAGLTAYSYVIQGDDGEAGKNWTRGLAGMALLGLGAGGFLLRRRLI